VSLLLFGVLLAVLSVVVRVHTRYLASRNETRQPVILGQPRPATSSPVEVFWPAFLRSSPRNARQCVMNGISVLNEDWQCPSTSLDVLDYYRSQMTARGWQDVTEETYGLSPELTAGKVQDAKYVENYRKVTSTNLVLRRHSWTMHVIAEPLPGPMPQTVVKVVAAETASIADLALPQTERQLDVVERKGNEQYHTTLQHSPSPLDEAFQQALADQQARGWQLMLSVPARPGQTQRFAWLAKGSQYAALVARPSPDQQGSAVLLTEVTPE